MKVSAIHEPASLEEAIQLLAHLGPRARPLAGGTDLLLEGKRGIEPPEHLVSLSGIPGLDFIQDTVDLRIGAATTLSAIAASALVRQRCPMLAEAVGMIGALQTRNLATLGGNLCNAVPSADSAPPLLAADARVTLVGPAGTRTLPLVAFFLGPRRTTLETGELMTEILIPQPLPHTGGTYRRHTTRRALDLAVVGVAASLTLDPSVRAVQSARIALGAVAPVPLRAEEAERVLAGHPPGRASFASAAQAAAQAACPISDGRASAAYRLSLVQTLVLRCLSEAFRRAGEQAEIRLP